MARRVSRRDLLRNASARHVEKNRRGLISNESKAVRSGNVAPFLSYSTPGPENGAGGECAHIEVMTRQYGVSNKSTAIGASGAGSKGQFADTTQKHSALSRKSKITHTKKEIHPRGHKGDFSMSEGGRFINIRPGCLA